MATTTKPRRSSTGAARRARPAVDAIRLLKDDHRTIKELFKRYGQLSERASKTKGSIVEKVVRELSVHAAIEEEFLYPMIRRRLPDGEKLATEGLLEHREAKQLLAQIDGAEPEGQEFAGKFKLLVEDVMHHIKEEESELFPRLRAAVGRDELLSLATSMKAAKKTAPTRPHPRLPDTPPANIIASIPAAVFDRARDAARELIRGK